MFVSIQRALELQGRGKGFLHAGPPNTTHLPGCPRACLNAAASARTGGRGFRCAVRCPAHFQRRHGLVCATVLVGDGSWGHRVLGQMAQKEDRALAQAQPAPAGQLMVTSESSAVSEEWLELPRRLGWMFGVTPQREDTGRADSTGPLLLLEDAEGRRTTPSEPTGARGPESCPALCEGPEMWPVHLQPLGFPSPLSTSLTTLFLTNTPESPSPSPSVGSPGRTACGADRTGPAHPP